MVTLAEVNRLASSIHRDSIMQRPSHVWSLLCLPVRCASGHPWEWPKRALYAQP